MGTTTVNVPLTGIATSGTGTITTYSTTSSFYASVNGSNPVAAYGGGWTYTIAYIYAGLAFGTLTGITASQVATASLSVYVPSDTSTNIFTKSITYSVTTDTGPVTWSGTTVTPTNRTWRSNTSAAMAMGWMTLPLDISGWKTANSTSMTVVIKDASITISNGLAYSHQTNFYTGYSSSSYTPYLSLTTTDPTVVQSTRLFASGFINGVSNGIEI